MTRSRDAQAARDTALQELDLPAANRLAIERAQSRRFLESLPYFRRELQLLDHDVWGLHYDFATVLNDAAFEERVRRGVSVRATRGTLERAALVRESLQELDRAEASVSRRDDLARVRERRAHILWSWGFRWDGIAGYRAALSALPTSRSIPGRLEQRRSQMIDPLRAPDDESALP